jgi:hypothetical protein
VFDSTPANTMMTVTRPGGAFSTMLRITAVSQPDRSATPTPSRATRTVPSGANSTKFRTRLRTIILNPSAFRRLTTSISPLAARPFAPSGRGSTTDTSKYPSTPDTMTTAMANSANSETGCGSALPSHSTACRKRVMRVLFG